MTQSQLFSIAVRILGVFLLVQAVLQIPMGVVNGVFLIYIWIRGTGTNPYVLPSLYPAIFTALLSFVVFVACGLYLLAGAPLLFRLAKIKPADAAVE
jgi:hypothetical protein